MAWVIDRDYVTRPGDGLPSRVGRGQGDFVPGEPTYRFRLRDEDGEVHYGGRYDAAAVENDEEEGGLYQSARWGEYDSGAVIHEIRPDDALRFGLMRPEYLEQYTRDGWTMVYG